MEAVICIPYPFNPVSKTRKCFRRIFNTNLVTGTFGSKRRIAGEPAVMHFLT